MSGKFGEKWLDWAVEIEEKADCDIEAGSDLGRYLGEYLAKSRNYINREKLMSFLQEELGNLLSQRELEEIANATQNYAREHIQEKIQSSEVA